MTTSPAPFIGEPDPIEFWFAKSVSAKYDSNPDKMIFHVASRKTPITDDFRMQMINLVREGHMQNIAQNRMEPIYQQSKIEESLIGLIRIGVDEDTVSELRRQFAEARLVAPAPVLAQ